MIYSGYFNVQNTTVARAKTIATSFNLMIGGGAKFEIAKLLTMAPARTKMQMRTSDW